MENIKLGDLTPDQKKALMVELEKEQRASFQNVKNQREIYKGLVDDGVKKLFPILQMASECLSDVKSKSFDYLQTLIKLKSELYNREEDQGSHSFSSTDGLITITVGYNMTDGWDDTVNTGIAKVNDYMQSLVTTATSKMLVETVMKLLSKDGKGNLKASRVLQLKQLADKTEDKNFIDAIAIIQDAYKPVRSKEYIRCDYKGVNGEKIILPLSITEAPFKELSKGGTPPDLA